MFIAELEFPQKFYSISPSSMEQSSHKPVDRSAGFLIHFMHFIFYVESENLKYLRVVPK